MSSHKTTDPYAEMRTRQHSKRDDAARALADWAESGESLTGFARRNQLGLHRLQWWRAQLAQAPAAERESVRLLAVVPRRAPLIALGSGALSVTVGAVRIDVSDVMVDDYVAYKTAKNRCPAWLACCVGLT